MTEITLMTWNILEGFHTRPPDGSRVMDTARLERAHRVVNRVKPDILVLNEALWCHEAENYLVSYAELLGFPYSACALYDKHWGNAILSREPITDIKSFKIHNRGGLNVLTCGIRVATYHPHPSRYPENKKADFRKLAELSEGPAVICGDFNAISPDDHIDTEKLVRSFMKFSSNPERDAARFIDAGNAVFPELTALGFTNSINNHLRTMPTRLISDDMSSAMRIDHIMVRDMGIVHSFVPDYGDDTELASDHLPVVAVLKIG